MKLKVIPVPKTIANKVFFSLVFFQYKINILLLKTKLQSYNNKANLICFLLNFKKN